MSMAPLQTSQQHRQWYTQYLRTTALLLLLPPYITLPSPSPPQFPSSQFVPWGVKLVEFSEDCHCPLLHHHHGVVETLVQQRRQGKVEV